MAAGEETSHILSGLTNQLPDRDPEETAEWLESLDALIQEQGTERAQYIMRSLLQRAGAQSVVVTIGTPTDCAPARWSRLRIMYWARSVPCS